MEVEFTLIKGYEEQLMNDQIRRKAIIYILEVPVYNKFSQFKY